MCNVYCTFLLFTSLLYIIYLTCFGNVNIEMYLDQCCTGTCKTGARCIWNGAVLGPVRQELGVFGSVLYWDL
jgi:hypothetical protein